LAFDDHADALPDTLDVTDTHIRILAMAARHSQRQLDDHDAVKGTPSAGSAERRQDLEERARRTRARVVAARARRRQAPEAEER
jgi:hypothetical protein